MYNFPLHKIEEREFHFVLFSEAISVKHWEEDVRMLVFALQSNSSNCLMEILHRQLGNYLLNTGETYGPTYPQDFVSYRSMFDTYQQVDYSPRPMIAYCNEHWCQSVAVRYVEK